MHSSNITGDKDNKHSAVINSSSALNLAKEKEKRHYYYKYVDKNWRFRYGITKHFITTEWFLPQNSLKKKILVKDNFPVWYSLCSLYQELINGSC